MNFQKQVPLKNYSYYKIGGPAKFFVEVSSVGELKEALKQAQDAGEKVFVLGQGGKVLISDRGFDGLVIHNKIGGIERIGNKLIVGSGLLIKEILDYCIDNSLSGLQWAGGLPGTIGGAVRGNAGAFGTEMKDCTLEVRSLNMTSLEEVVRGSKMCAFDYRNSTFKSGEASNEFITSVILGVEPGNQAEIKAKIQEKIDYRNLHQPMDLPSLGSTFKNIPVSSLPEKLQKEFAEIVKNDPFPVVLVTKLLSLGGLKGKRIGDAVISEKQPNFIVNVGNATAADVKALIDFAKKTIKEKYGITIAEEINYLN